MTLKLQGAFTALVTPFTEDGSAVDYAKLRELVEWQIQEGINGLVPVRSDRNRLRMIMTSS
jgi:4-hydroxy-tetrahydrodipicolinate synthase